MLFSLVPRVFEELRTPERQLPAPLAPRAPVPLASRLSTGELAWSSVAAATVASSGSVETIDASRIAVAYRSDRVLTINGSAPTAWAPLSGFQRAADGWIRTHANYLHHAHRLLTALDLDATATADEVRSVIGTQTATQAVSAITEAGGLAVRVLPEDRATDAALRASPLFDIARRDTGWSLPRDAHSREAGLLEGIRVLDLTRVIAGPIATRTLALWGAEVLRVDPPGLEEPEWQHFDTGHGKRSTILDARSARMEELLSAADVVVLGYRASSLDRIGLSAESLAERHPHLLVAQLTAWGLEHPSRPGFDSLVQAESGIALVESPDGDRPGALPAQALDHSAGYLLATAIIELLERRRREGGSWYVHTSLRRIAAELLGMPRTHEPLPVPDLDVDPHTASFSSGGRSIITARPALPGHEFTAPRRWGRDQPRW